MTNETNGISLRRLKTFLTNLKNIFAEKNHSHATSDITGLDTSLSSKATFEQGRKADSAVQSVKIGTTEYKSGTTVTLPSYPTSLPASDVYDWAKASSKPSYTKDEVGLGNVDNTADSAKSVKYATSAGSASSVSWANVSGKPSTFTPSSHTHDDRYYTESEINTKLNNKANVFKYEFSNHDVYRCLGTATLKQEGDYLILHIYCGDGYNADINQDRTIDVHIRASNGSAVNGKYYIGYIESHLNGATNCNVYVVQNSSTSFTIWIGKLNYSGRSFYEVQFPSGDSWVPAANTSTTIPTNGVALIEKKIAYTDVATTSTNGLMSKDMVTKLNGITSGANMKYKEVTQSAYSSLGSNYEKGTVYFINN